MGGQDGSRGYLFQAIIAVLNSLDDKNWTRVQIEPNTDDEKVDILWTYANNELKVSQVKSSINNFTKPEIIDWVEKLYNDVKSAEKYEIVLIGNISDINKKIINKVSSGEENLSDKLKKIKGKLNIKIIPFDENLMFSGIFTAINKFVSSYGYTVDYFTLENISRAIIYQFFNLGIIGVKVSRNEFEDKLLEWIKFNYSKIFGAQNKLNKLEIAFYNNTTNEFSSEIYKFNFKNLNKFGFEQFKHEISEIVNEIKSIKIIESSPKFGKVVIRDLEGNDLSREYLSAEIRNKQKDYIKEQLTNIFNIDVNEKFFYVGKVLEPTLKIVSIYDENNIIYFGSKTEIEKRAKIDLLVNKIETYKDYQKFVSSIESFSIIPLVLKNIGNVFDEKIRVIIKLPKDIMIFDDSDLDIADNINLLKLLNENKQFVKSIFKHSKDSLVSEYEIKTQSYNFFPSFMKSKEEKIKEEKKDLINLINSCFLFDYYNEDPNNIILEFRFKELNPKENIGFPCYLLTKINKDVEINYEITTKNSHDKIIGKLIYKNE